MILRWKGNGGSLQDEIKEKEKTRSKEETSKEESTKKSVR